MIIQKSLLSQVLSSFSGEYREVFCEKSESVLFRLLNGKVEAPNIRENTGFSLLSRSGKEEFFSSYSGLENILEKTQEFTKLYNFSSSPIETLTWPETYSFESRDLSLDLDRFLPSFDTIKTISGEHSEFLMSYDINILSTQKQYIVGNNRGSFAKDEQYYNTIYISLVGQKDGLVEEILEKITGTDVFSDLSSEVIVDTFKKAIEKLLLVLSGSPAPSGMMDVVIGSESGGTIIHEAVGHGLEADLQNSSAYRGKLGQKVAADNVNVIDDPTRANLRGYYDVDHEGIPSKKTYLIKDGILVSYLHNRKTAELFETESTGHGRREDYSYATMVRMGTTYLDNGTDTKESLIARVKDGIYVAQMWGGQVNTTTGDFVFRVHLGYRIREGKLAEVIRGANISGNGPKMLLDIQWIANDLGFFDGGTCGKGQSMPVSDATPTILVKMKVTGQ